MTRPWSSAAIGAWRPSANGKSSEPFFTSNAGNGYSSHSAKNVGRRWVVGTPDQSNTCSAIQWSRDAWLFASRLAGF